MSRLVWTSLFSRINSCGASPKALWAAGSPSLCSSGYAMVEKDCSMGLALGLGTQLMRASTWTGFSRFLITYFIQLEDIPSEGLENRHRALPAPDAARGALEELIQKIKGILIGLVEGWMYFEIFARLNFTTRSLIIGSTSSGNWQLAPKKVFMSKSSFDPGFSEYQHFSCSFRLKESKITPVKSVTVKCT